ncbi:hypothetical protein NO995_08045 [Aestuariibaculum sp. M13]|uniref:hypothetical protein n=1 Tax=Aestuariibaculum sp. M13 TaxID=2967132 RepID=UPI002159E84B|nr:hypothetical protein [Aestuariibaculum sp. M13]MCR8667629.1 hypothetical protein [Aestuariibaculum sp. M13]
MIIGSIIATLIAITPYLFYLYESAPDIQVWDTFLFTYDSKYYGSIFVLAWTLTGKVIPLYLIFIWFFTCRHWWYHVLLVPIAMYAYQIFITLNDDLDYVDSNQLIYLIPIMAVIVPSIYLIRAQIFNKINNADKTMEELEDEFKMTPKNFWDRLRNYF